MEFTFCSSTGETDSYKDQLTTKGFIFSTKIIKTKCYDGSWYEEKDLCIEIKDLESFVKMVDIIGLPIVYDGMDIEVYNGYRE